MKIKLKLPKPRNPLVLPARQRKAGAHASDNPERRTRRIEKHHLRRLLSGHEGDLDA